jgi:membrane protein DedA with SNARE-associated domain
MRNKTIIPAVILSTIAILISSLTIGRQIFLQRQPDLISFLSIHFAGYLFFILMPVEILFTYYLIEGFNIYVLLIGALATAMIAQTIDYFIGYMASNHVIYSLVGEKKYKKTERYIHRYGNHAVFLFNLFPLSSSILSLVAGMLKFRFRNFLAYSFLGLTIKYIFLIFLFS